MLGQTATIDAMKARLNEINLLLAALEIGTLQQAPDGEWYACYWDEELQRTQCERSGPPSPLQAQVLAMSPSERARRQQELTAEAADLVRQINDATQQFYYGDLDPSQTVVRVTSQQTPEGPVQVITRGPMDALPGDVTPGPNGNGAPVVTTEVLPNGDTVPVVILPEAPATSKGLYAAAIALGLLLLFGGRRGRS